MILIPKCSFLHSFIPQELQLILSTVHFKSPVAAMPLYRAIVQQCLEYFVWIPQLNESISWSHESGRKETKMTRREKKRKGVGTDQRVWWWASLYWERCCVFISPPHNTRNQRYAMNLISSRFRKIHARRKQFFTKIWRWLHSLDGSKMVRASSRSICQPKVIHRDI